MKWKTCVYRLNNLGAEQVLCLMVYLLSLWAALGGELMAILCFPYTVWKIFTRRRDVKSPKEAASLFLELLDPLHINADVFAIVNLSFGQLSALCYVVFHLLQIVDFFTGSKRTSVCAYNFARSHPYSYCEVDIAVYLTWGSVRGRQAGQKKLRLQSCAKGCIL